MGGAIAETASAILPRLELLGDYSRNGVVRRPEPASGRIVGHTETIPFAIGTLQGFRRPEETPSSV